MERRIPATARLVPPFSKNSAIHSSSKISYPSSFRYNYRLLDPQEATRTYLEVDLKTPKLNVIHRHLWLAGRPRPARPLHRQRLMRRTVRLTESPDEHLVWQETCIFIKPIPEYLLDYSFWEQQLCCDEGLYRSACGLLLSYAWLVSSAADWRIAEEVGIMPKDIDWDSWTIFIRNFLGCVDTISLQQVDKRYYYGELRLSRLNALYRFSPSTFSPRNLVYGFMPSSTWRTAFFERNFGWILAVFVYMTVILSAMQVGLATERLQGNSQFQNFSYSVALMSIAVVLAAMLLVLSAWFALFCYHMFSAIQYSNKAELERRLNPEKA